MRCVAFIRVCVLLSVGLLSVSSLAVREYENEWDPNAEKRRRQYQTRQHDMVRVFVPIYGGFGTPHHSGEEVRSGLGQNFGLVAGFGYNFQLRRRWGFGVDFLYVQKPFSTTDALGTANWELTYLEIPVQVTYAFTKMFSVHVGPYFASALLAAKRNGVEAEDQFGSDYGLTGGVLLEFGTARWTRVGLNLRYDFGLVDIRRGRTVGEVVQTRTMYLLVFAKFRI